MKLNIIYYKIINNKFILYIIIKLHDLNKKKKIKYMKLNIIYYKIIKVC